MPKFKIHDSLLYLLVCIVSIVNSFGPLYPVTGAWFKDRYSVQEWNNTLHRFSTQGSDTVLRRAPALQIRTRDEILSDSDFQVGLR